MVLVLKTSVGQLTASSNLALSAKKNNVHLDVIFLAPWSRFDLAGDTEWRDREFGVMSEAEKCLYFFEND